MVEQFVANEQAESSNLLTRSKLGVCMTAYYAYELSDESVEAIRNSQPSKEAEELNKLLGL